MEIITGKIINKGIMMGKIYYYEKNISRPKFSNNSILVAKEIAPNEVVKFSKLEVAAFVLQSCSATSHTSILTRTMNIPAIFDIDVKEQWNNRMAIVDGYEGIIILDPDENTLLIYHRKKEEKEEEKRAILNTYKGRNAETKSGKKIHLYANINNFSDIRSVIENDAEGIGVFKSEFIYLEASDFPTETEQFEIYKELAIRMNGKKVIIRTLDIGADKKVEYFKLDKEENPAMGYRAIRICLDRVELFKTQLRAILKSSFFGNVSIMYPMIISVEEVNKAKEILNEVMSELRDEAIPFNENIEQGIMIETPASVIMSDQLAKYVDFFSIGTNDLTQYTLAADRQNPKLETIIDPYHPAIFRSIKTVVENAHKAGIWVSISGELGADISVMNTLLDYGIDALAVAPSKILEIRKAICELE